MKINNLVGAIVLALCFTNTTIAQIVSIPDENFKAVLISDATINTNGDSEIQISEAEAVDSLDVSNEFIMDMAGIEAFTALEYLNCENNFLFSNLDLSSNALLTYLDCSGDSLISLDVSNNTALEYLYCDYNFLSTITLGDKPSLITIDCSSSTMWGGALSLDLSTAPALENFYGCCNIYNGVDVRNNPVLKKLFVGSCGGISSLDVTKNSLLEYLDIAMAQITALDVSNNSLLQELSCFDNRLTVLDLSNNPALTKIRCEMNPYLGQIDLRNGNNSIVEIINALYNDNLYCIAVDDAEYSNLNWDASPYEKEIHTEYTDNLCQSIISGIIYHDENGNCTKDENELKFVDAIVKLTGTNVFHAAVNSDGSYQALVNPESEYDISVESVFNATNFNDLCNSGSQSVTSPEIGATLSDIDFGLDIELCSQLSVEISASRMRRCFRNYVNINYINTGILDEPNAKVYVDFPEYVEFISSTETAILVDPIDKIYMFDIGNVSAFGRGYIGIIDSVICGNEEIRGFTQCIKTWITPVSNCYEIKDTTDWDKSSIVVDDYVVCDDNSTAQFTIINAGDGDMLTAHEYRLFYDNELTYTGSFQLGSGDSLLIDASADGSTIRIEADQHPLHPGKSRPRTTIEGCGVADLSKASVGFWPEVPNDDLDIEVSEICLMIRDSYDPNDKKVSPAGITESHYVPENDPLEYKIRFQNTGNDEAYNIVVVDTLSSQLNIAKLNITGASHDYSFEISGEDVNILTFTFNDIYLPDSTSNEPESHGYVTFKIAPINDITPGTPIENFADIYFDYNSAIRTDTAAVIALDTVITSEKVITVSEVFVGVNENNIVDVRVFPNPTNEYIIIDGDVTGFDNIQIYDVIGKLMINEKMLSENQLVNVSHLRSGTYFIQLAGSNAAVRTFKMIKE